MGVGREDLSDLGWCSLLLVIHPILQAGWGKQVVPQLVGCWRGKRSLCSVSEASLSAQLLAQVNEKRRASTQGLPQLLLLQSYLWKSGLLVAKSSRSASQAQHGVLLGPGA